MNKLLSLLTVLAISGSTMAFAPAIEGEWGSQQTSQGMVFDFTFSFRNNLLTLTNVCTLFGRSAQAQVTIPVTYDDTTLIIQKSAHNEQSNAGVTCNVSIEPDQLRYVVQGNQLILSKEGSDQNIVLNRK